MSLMVKNPTFEMVTDQMGATDNRPTNNRTFVSVIYIVTIFTMAAICIPVINEYMLHNGWMAQSYLEFQIGQKNIYFTITNIILLLAKNNTVEFLTKVTLVIISLRNCNFFYRIQGNLDDVKNHNFLTCAKVEIWALTVCIVVNREKFQSHALTLTLIGQCPMSNSSELFSYTTISEVA